MRSLLLLLVYAGMALPAALVVFPWTWISRNKRLLFWAGFGITAVGLRAVGVRPRVSGRENLPTRAPCIFMANHISNLDPIVLLPATPSGTVIYFKRSLTRIPFLNLVMRTAGFIPVDRSGSLRSAKQSLLAARRALEGGASLVVFPEGTRSPDGKLLPFKSGPFHLAMETGTPVVPVTLAGTGELMPRGSLRLRKGTPDVHFHPALWPRQFPSRDALMEAVRAVLGGTGDTEREAREGRPQ